jgi:DNA-binding CsgD family transcriptional regulator
MLFAAREPVTAKFSAPGIPELKLSGLLAADALALLGATTPLLAQEVAERLVTLAAGNPLALLEFPRALRPASAEGHAPLDEPLPVRADTERTFFGRAAGLSAETRRALLLVAAGDPEEHEAIRRALSWNGAEASALAEAEATGLIELGRLRFSHPLARSAVYHSAPQDERRAAHAALGAASTELDRRAWHLAAASDQPDEDVAALLEGAADAARRRGGVAAEAKALERAARLTPDQETGARRLYKAALAAEAAGWLSQAEVMLRDAADILTDRDLRARAVARRSYLLFDRGEFDRAFQIAVEALDRARPAEAVVLLTESGAIHVLHHRLDIPTAVATAEKAWRLAGTALVPTPSLAYVLAWNWALSGRAGEALSMARSSLDRLDPSTVAAIDLGSALLYLEDYPRAREVLERVVGRLRETYASGTLSYALSQLAKLELRSGDIARAYELELESQQLTDPLPNDVALADNLAWLALMESMLGRAESRAHAERALTIAESRNDHWNVARARAALGSDALARSDASEAVRWLEPAVAVATRGGVEHPNFLRIDADLIEGLARVGRIEEARRHLARLEEQAESTGSAWGRAVAARCRAFVSPDPDFEEAFDTALECHDRDPSALERARTALCLGERLRRAGRRKSAREHLRDALDAFQRAGSPPWAERARNELAASGEQLRRREAQATESLTPQEVQIALLVAEGLSNREMAARLFLSVKTVEFHLTRIYRKLRVHSRSELVRHMLMEMDPEVRLPPLA